MVSPGSASPTARIYLGDQQVGGIVHEPNHTGLLIPGRILVTPSPPAPSNWTLLDCPDKGVSSNQGDEGQEDYGETLLWGSSSMW